MRIPERLETLLQIDTSPYGTNCWNCTKAFFDHNAPIQHTDQFEMVEWLNANTVPISEQDVQIGDIAVWSRGSIDESNGMEFGNGLVHTAVYVKSWGIGRRMFHKRGVNGPFEVVSQGNVHGIYNGRHRGELSWRRYVGPNAKREAA